MQGRCFHWVLVGVLMAGACTTAPTPSPTRTPATTAVPASTPAATTRVVAVLASAAVRELDSPLSPRIEATGVWTGQEVILWGGAQWQGDGVTGPLGDGGAYDPASDSWQMLPQAPIEARAAHVAGWTGRELLVWGGYVKGGTAPAATTGAAYDPTTGQWRTLPPAPVVWTKGAASIWTGSEWVIAVALDRAERIEVAAYDPGLDRWRQLPGLPGPLSVENQLSWTGSELLLVNVADGLFRLDVDNDAWIPHATPPVWGPIAWAGNRLLGVADGNPYWSLVEWDPSTDVWAEIPLPEFALLREADLVWTGDRAIFPNSGLAFEPSTSRWWRLDPPASLDRSDSVILWAGDRVLMLSGWPGGPSEPIPFGEAYVPAW